LNATDPLGLIVTSPGSSDVGNIYILVNPDGVPFYVGKTTRDVSTRVAEHSSGPRAKPVDKDETIDLGEFDVSDLPTVEQFVQDYLGLRTGRPGNVNRALARSRSDFDEVQTAGRELIAEQADPLTGENSALYGVVQAKALQNEAYTAGDPLAREQIANADALNGGLPQEDLSTGASGEAELNDEIW
jgi:hypothetical protein